MSHTYRVKTVCTGNICRPPMAEVVLRARFAAAGLGDVAVRMCRSFDPAAAGLAERLLDVEDPWYGDDGGFVTTLRQVEAAADGVVAHVRSALG